MPFIYLHIYIELFSIRNVIELAVFHLAGLNNPRPSYWTRLKHEVKSHLNVYAGLLKYIITRLLFLKVRRTFVRKQNSCITIGKRFDQAHKDNNKHTLPNTCTDTLKNPFEMFVGPASMMSLLQLFPILYMLD